LDKWLASVNRKIADRVRPLVEKYDEDREKEVEKYIRDMKRAAKKIEIPGIGRRGDDRRGGGRFSEYFEKLVDEAMEEVEESGEIPANIPERAPREFHKLTDEARGTVETMDKEHEEELKKQLEFYTNGLLKKAMDIAKDGFTKQSSSLKQMVEDIGDDTKKFTTALGL
jgi:hypothetical protein